MSTPRRSALIEQPQITRELREARYAQRFPQKLLARKMGVSQQTFSEWERGYRQAPIDRVIVWAVSLGYRLELTKE